MPRLRNPVSLRPASLPRGWRAALRELPGALLAVVVTRAILTVSSLDRARRDLLPAGARAVAVDLVRVARIAWAVRLAARLVPFATCLTQAQACQVLLARLGYPSTLALGVCMNANGRVRAHAWLLCEGQAVLGGDREVIREFRMIAELGSVA